MTRIFFKEFQKKFKFVSSVYIANVKRDWLRNRERFISSEVDNFAIDVH